MISYTKSKGEEKMNRERMFICGMLIFNLLISIVLIYDLYNSDFIQNSLNQNKTAELIFEDLNEDEINIVLEIVKDLKPGYLTNAKKIFFVKNWTKDYHSHISNNISGFNINEGEMIYVKYTDDSSRVRNIICHELLHTVVDCGECDEEYVVSRMQDTCFSSPPSYAFIDCSFPDLQGSMEIVLSDEETHQKIRYNRLSWGEMCEILDTENGRSANNG